MLTIENLVKQRFGNITYDTALPQDVVNHILYKCDYDIRANFITWYPKGSSLPVLLPLTLKGFDAAKAKGFLDPRAEEFFSAQRYYITVGPGLDTQIHRGAEPKRQHALYSNLSFETACMLEVAYKHGYLARLREEPLPNKV